MPVFRDTLESLLLGSSPQAAPNSVDWRLFRRRERNCQAGAIRLFVYHFLVARPDWVRHRPPVPSGELALRMLPVLAMAGFSPKPVP